MSVSIDLFFRIKGFEEQLAEIRALMEECGDDFEKFNEEVAKLAIDNNPEDYEDSEPEDNVVPCYYQNVCYMEDDDVLAFDLGSDDDDFDPDSACALGYLLDSAFPGVEANWLYRCDEAGDHGLFAKGGDSVEDFWSANYVLEISGEDDNWFDELDELIECVEEVTGKEGLESFEDCVEAMEEYDEENEGDGFILVEIDMP